MTSIYRNWLQKLDAYFSWVRPRSRRTARSRSRVRVDGIESLETRVLLSSSAHVFANYDGQIATPGSTDRIDFEISSAEFTLTGGKTTLGFQLSAGDGGSLDPAAVTIRAAGSNAIVTPALSRPDLAANRQSLVLAELAQGSYYLTVAAERNSSGPYRLNTFLVGDVNGDRRVDTADGTAINTLIRNSQYQIEADANLDGAVTAYDYSQWRTNLNDATTLNPLALTVSAAPSPVVLPGGTRATNQTTLSLVGTTSPSASLAVETGADNGYDNGSTTASGTGAYTVSGVILAEGANTLRVRSRSTSRFTQQRLDSLAITLDTHAPVVVVDAPVSAVPTNRNVTITGRITDDRTGVATLKGQLDSGPLFDLAFDASGAFHFSTALALDGTADGPHNIHLRGTDRVGNLSNVYDAPFTLDTRPPTVVVDSPAPLTITNRNVTVVGRVTDDRTGVATLQAQVDSGPLVSVAFDAQGAFSFPTTLPLDGTADGAHVVHFRGTDRAGNLSSIVDLPLTLDTRPPVVTVNSPSPGTATNRNVTVIGQVTDDRAGVTRLQAQLDDGTPFDVAFDSQGAFSFPTTLPLDGSDDGPHTVRLQGTDRAGNVSGLFDVSFSLDSRSPAAAFDLSIGSDTGALGDHQTEAGRVTLTGQTEPGATVRLLETGATALVANTGGFLFTGVTLALGDNQYTVVATDALGNSTQIAHTFTRIAASGQTDPVLAWNQVALQAIKLDADTPPEATRGLAIVHSAILDAVNSIEGTPGRYVLLPAASGTSVLAAVASAAHRALSYLYPAQQATFDAALATSLAEVPDGASKTDGIALGQGVADAIIEMRKHDGQEDYVDYLGGNDPGQWRPTEPMFDVPLLPQWGDVQPFVLPSADGFFPDGPPEISSQEYADAFNQVKSLGSADSTTRTADQTQIARYWADGMGTYTPPGHWNSIADSVAMSQGNSVAENARMLAQLNVALADAAIVCWDIKFTEGFWRPITAIREAASDGNSQTTEDPNWLPLLVTPAFPEYVSGHSTFSGTAAEILTAMFGDNYAFTSGSETPQNFVRSFSSFEQAAQEASFSRILGGIHFLFAGNDGLATGGQIGAAVLQSFSTSSDTQAPTIVFNSTPAATAVNLSLAGQIVDNLAGLQSVTIQWDGGAVAPLGFDSYGRFSVPTDLATDGTDDGAHHVRVVATDALGNVSTREVSYTLDTASPIVSVTTPAENGQLADGDHLMGTVDGTGSGISQLTYAFDGGAAIPVVADANGAFDIRLDLSRLAAGPHVLVVSATDAAGNSSQVTRHLTLPQSTRFTISGYSPAAGSLDVGVTVRPQIFFARAVDVTTLNSNNFYASFGGQKLAATIVPASDGSFAWLFFEEAMPDASLIRVTVDGSTILSLDGAVALDADRNGAPGGVLTFDFTTVSVVPVANTSLVGIIADPGPDLTPHTFDDVRPGPDGVLMTDDDVYLRPIAGVRVSLIGIDQVIVTGADGRFRFDSVPIGNTKLVLDGLSATLPTGADYYFPEMVMDVNIAPGVMNFTMEDMEELYLPRIANAILDEVLATTGATIVADAIAAPDLTPAQRQNLTIDVQPGSLIGPDGRPLTSAQIGISTVPAELVRDMLPPGVLQHTFDITVQALGVSTLSTPAPMTFPNVFGAAPGTQLNFLSFDHTTGRLVIEGTATVSQDGLSVSTDPGTGVTHPGWHGLAPAGGCGGSGGPPPPPPPPPSPMDTSSPPVTEVEDLITGEPGFFSNSFFELEWDAPDRLPDTPPPPPPPPGCAVPPHDPSQDLKQPYIKVTIDVDGPLGDFLKKSGSLDLISQSFTLTAGSGEHKSFEGEAKTYSEMFSGSDPFKNINQNILYGSKVKVTEVSGNPDGSTHTQETTYYLYRFIDAADADHDDERIEFEDSLSGVIRSKTLDMRIGSAAPALSASGAFAAAGANVTFQPSFAGLQNGALTIKTPTGETVGTVALRGHGEPVQMWYVDSTAMVDGFRYAFDNYATAPEKAVLGTADIHGNIVFDEAKVRNIISMVIVQAQSKLGAFSSGLANSPFAGPVTIVIDDFESELWTRSTTFGQASGVDNQNTSFFGNSYSPEDIVKNRTKYSVTEQNFRISEALNENYYGSIDIYVDHYYSVETMDWTLADLVNALGKTMAHEIGHEVGLNHTHGFDTSDVMAWGIDRAGTMSFGVTANAFKIAVGMNWSSGDAQQAIDYFKQYIGTGGNYDAPEWDEGDQNAGPGFHPLDGVLWVEDVGGSYVNDIDFGRFDISGGTSTHTLRLSNIGDQPAHLSGASIVGAGAFTIHGLTAGMTLDPGQFAEFTVSFDPSVTGKLDAKILLNSDANVPDVELSLVGFGVTQSPHSAVVPVRNNVGAIVASHGSLHVQEVAAITNHGIDNLVITSIRLAEGVGRFSLTGVPADLATHPIELAIGESFAFGASFDPDHVGLDRALIDIVTNDPTHPITRISAVGTGLAEIVYPEWGNDYQAVDTPNLPGSDTLRTVSDNSGNFGIFLPPEQFYHYSSFDLDTGLIGHSYGTTAPSGRGVDLTASIVFQASTAPDSDFDGLPDDVEHAIGTFVGDADTNNDGIDDYTAIQQGIDALGDNALPIGIIGTVRPQGNFFVQDVVASSDFAFLAAGAGGIQVVNISKITKPSVIASVPASTLGGDAVAVAFTSIPGATPGTTRNLVAAALGSKGVAIIDVTDPPAAQLVTRIPVPGSAVSIEIVDNLAYVGGSGGLVSMLDMKTGELISTYTAAGSGDVSAVKFSAGTLYTLRGGTLAAYDIASNLANPRLLSSIVFSGATHLSVGSERAYVTGNEVFEAVDVTDPSNLQNTSGARPALNYRGLAANGSGRLIVSEIATFRGNSDARVGLFNVQNPDDTNSFLTEFDTPGSVQDVWIQNGLGLIADGAGGFAIFNYLGFDEGETPPTITVATTSIDGVTAIEGSRMRVDVTTLDDVQTRRVSLVANGVALEPDGSFPFSFFVDVPTLDSGATTLLLEVTATDTGGNQSTETREFTIVDDNVAPALLSVLPADDKIQFNSVPAFRVIFNEPLDVATLSSDSVRVVEAGADGDLETTDDVAVALSSFDFRLSLNLLTISPVAPLPQGKYELQLDRAEITDRTGNPLGVGVFRSQVTVQAIPFNAVINGAIDTAGEIDLFSFGARTGDEITLFADWNPGGINLSAGQISLVAPDGFTVLAAGEGSGSTLLPDITLPADGLYTIRIRSSSNQPLAQGSYRFTISDPETATESISYGQFLTRSIAVRGDDHEWRFHATVGDLVNFSYVGPDLEGGIRIFNPDGSEFATVSGGTTILLFATPATQTGDYRFTIDDDTSTGSYTIQLDQGSFADEVAGLFNAVQGGTLTRLYDVDRFRYTLAAGDEITAFGNLSGIGAGTIRLIDAATFAELTPSKSGAQPQITNYVSDANRDVFVEVRGVTGSVFHTGSYTLTVSDPESAFETIAFGGVESRSFAVRGDDQEWQFAATGGEVVTLGYRGPSLDSGIVVKRPDGTTLATLPAGPTIVARDLVLTQHGTYRFILADDDATGAYTLNLSNPADVESPGTALTANTPTSDSIGTIFDIDVFTFQATAGDAFSLLAEWQPGGTGLGSGEMVLWNPAGTVVGSVSGSGSKSLAVTSADAGTYTLRVRAATGNDFATGAYRLTAYSGAESPTNDTLATAIVTGISTPLLSHYEATGFIGDNIHGLRDVDMYQVHAERGDQIVVDLNAAASGSDLDTYVRLFDSAGAVLATNNDFGGSRDSYLTYTVLAAGDYTIGVSSSGNPGYNPATAGSGGGGSVGGYSIVLDVAKDFVGPQVISITPTGVLTAEDVMQFVIDFNERLNSTTANDAANYTLVSAGSDGVFDTGDDQTISVSPSYNGIQRVTLTTLDGADTGTNPDPLAVGFTYRLTLSGQATITDIEGNPLNDGQDEVALLELVSVVGTPTTAFPLTDGFETGNLASYWTVATSGGARVQVTSANTPTHGGTFHARFDNPGATGRAAMILEADLTGLDPNADVDLRFFHRDGGDGNNSMPASFSGRVNADGVAVSVDGLNWRRLVNLGASTESSYGTFVVDLDGALRSAGLPVNSQVRVLFQHYLSGGQTAFFDDVELAPHLAGPTIVGVSTPGPLVFASDLSSITVDFSEPLAELTANAGTSYELRRTDTNALIAVSPGYDSATRRVTLTTGILAQAPYQLTVYGDPAVGGVTVIRDENGNPLNNGASSVFNFELFNLESPLDDEIDTGTATGLTTGGSYSITTAIGNNVYRGRDIDLYAFTAGAGDHLTASTTSNNFGIPPGLNTLLRLFDATGLQLASNDDHSAGDTDSGIGPFQIPANGTYFLGVSSSTNSGYNPQIAPTGTAGAQGKYRMDVLLVDDITAPSVAKVVPHLGPNSNQSITAVAVTFSEAIPSALASDAANYTLWHLGADLLPGGGDDTAYAFTTAYNAGSFVATLSLTGPEALLPLPVGSYRLIVKGTTPGITDLAGNRLNSGVDVVRDFRVIAPEDPLNDRLSDAVETGIPTDGGQFTGDGAIGNNAFEARDVDLYRIEARDGIQFSATLNDRSLDSPLSARLRLFNDAGVQLHAVESSSSDDTLTFNITVEGTYYIGVSGSGNSNYNPVSPGSGAAASTTGEYILSIRTSDVVPPTVVSLTPDAIAVGANVTQIKAHFSEPMNVTGAESTASYELLYSGPDRRFGTGDERSLAFTAFYNIGTHEVTLTTDEPIPNGDVRLTLRSNGLVDPAGLPLNGGVNFVRTLSIVTAGAALNVVEPLDASPLGAQWLLNQSEANAIVEVTSAGGPRQGAGHLRLSGVTDHVETTATAILAVQPNGSSPVTLSFHSKLGSHDSGSWPDRYTLSASFTGSPTGDGVAISVDGNQWYRVVDLANQPIDVYQRFVVDLTAEAASHALSLTGPFLVRFSNTEYHLHNSPGFSAFFDDVRVAVGPATPFATAVLPGVFVSSAAPNTFGVSFSDDLATASAIDPANYQLIRAGADHLLGTADDVTVTVAARNLAYSATTDTVTFSFDSPLADDAYRITVLPTLTSPAGDPINDGLQQSFGFDVAATESTTNDTLGTSIDTGIVRIGDGTYAAVGAVGNNAQGGRDVDVYSFESGVGQRLAVNLTRFGASNADVRVRVFNAAGTELASAVTTSANPGAPILLFLNTNEIVYVGISAGVNSGYDPSAAGSGADGAKGLYALSIETRVGVAATPFSEGIEQSALPPYFVTYRADTSGVVAPSTLRARTGSQSLLLGDTNSAYTLVEATMTVDATVLEHTDLSFHALVPYYEIRNPLNPSAGRFTNHFNGDGVAFSVDGVTWFPVADFATSIPFINTWTRFEIDLNAAAAAAGVTLNAATRVRFQNYAYGVSSTSYYSYGIYIDDIRVDGDEVGPQVLTATGLDQFEVTGTLTGPFVQFTESLEAATAVLAANYQFQGDGPDNRFDTSDDVVFTVTPAYDDATRTTTLSLAGVTDGLPPDTYRLRLIGTGANGLKDPAGNLFQNGTNRDIVYAVFPTEETTNNTLATATPTGVDSTGGVFQTTGMLGNDGPGTAATFDDEDLYRVDLAANQALYVRGLSRFGNPNLRLRLFDSSGSQVTFLSGNDVVLDHFVLTTAGTYYVGISDSTNDSYSPLNGAGDTGTTRGLYDLKIQVVRPAAFPFTDGFESGVFDPAQWDIYGYDFGNGTELGVARVESTSPTPLTGSYSAVFNGPAPYSLSKTDLTLHLDLAGQANVDLRFKERNNNDYYYGGTTPQYDGRYAAGSQDGVFLSVDGSRFYRLPNVFNGSPQGILQRVVDLDEFAALNGLTLSADTQIRFEADNYYFDYSLQGRQIDDVRVVTDTVGPRLTRLTTDGGNTATTLLDGTVTQFVATFDDRLDTTRANDVNSYELFYAGADGLFPGADGDTGDESMVALIPSYDGEFVVTLSVDAAESPLQAGRYRLIVRGTGPTVLADREGNVLNDGTDEMREYRVVDGGPRVVSTSPASNLTVTPATGFSGVEVTFSENVLGASFDGNDVLIRDESGFIVVNASDISVTGSGTVWTIAFPAIHAPGQYSLQFGPQITDLVGHAMNQNQNVVSGEFNDSYTFNVWVTDTGSGTLYLYDQSSNRWDVSAHFGRIRDGGRVNPSNGNLTHSGSYDEMYEVEINGGTYLSSGSFRFDDGGRTVTTADRLINGFRIHREVYIPTDDHFARYVDVLTNPYSETITCRVSLSGSLGSDGSTVITASGSGDLLFDSGDTYLATDDGDGTGDLSLSHVLMDGNHVGLADAARSGDNLTWSFDVTLAPGQTVRLLTFAVQELNRAASQSQATRLVGLPAEALAHLSDEEKGTIINFDTGLDTVAPIVASIDPAPGRYFEGTLTQFTVKFSEPMNVESVGDAGNYHLFEAGSDGEFGTSDDVKVTLTPNYDVANRQVGLSFAVGSTPLPPGNYRLILNGTTGLLDKAGNLLNGGSDQVYEFQVFNQGPRVVDFSTDSPTSAFGWSNFVITFDQEIDADSFNGSDVQIFDQDGYIVPQDQIVVYENSDLTSWIVSIPAQFTPGNYDISLGPDIQNLFGEPMDQDGDLSNGEEYDDVYSTSVDVVSPSPGPYVVDFFTGDTGSDPGWSEFTVTFDHDIADFSQYAVWIYSNQTGQSVDQNQIVVSGSGTSWTVDFPAIQSPGSYSVQFGPFIYDDLGEPMNQDGDSFNGESDEDVYYTTVEVTGPTGPRVVNFVPGATSGISGWSEFTIFFDREIDPASFSGDDVFIYNSSTGAVVRLGGDFTIENIAVDLIQWNITFPAIHSPGYYRVEIGPNVTDLVGLAMNQSSNEYVNVDLTLLDASGFRYDVVGPNGILSDGGRIDPATGSRTHYDSYDGMYYLQIGSTKYLSTADFAVDEEGRIVITPDELVNGLLVHREIYVPTDEQFARYVDVFSNSGSTSVTRRITLSGNLGSDGATVITASGSGDLLFGTNDTYLATDDGDATGDLSLAHVLMDGNRLSLASATRSGDQLSWSFDVTVGAGETVRLLTFAVQQLNRASAQAQAISLVDLPAGALANLTAEEKSSILNFSISTQPLTLSVPVPPIARADRPELSPNQLDPIVKEAFARWSAAGVTTTRFQSLGDVWFGIRDLSGTQLGLATSGQIWIDDNAAGQGWFVDPTPTGDEEFVDPGQHAVDGGLAAERVDLLSVAMHELGHLLGFEHGASGDVMDATLKPGVRHTGAALEPSLYVSAASKSTKPRAVAPVSPLFSIPTDPIAEHPASNQPIVWGYLRSSPSPAETRISTVATTTDSADVYWFESVVGWRMTALFLNQRRRKA